MEEQLVSFETAKLAKEKGFNIHVRNYYSSEGILIENENFPYDSFIDSIFAPTQSLLQKWLREVHNTHIIIEPVFDEKDNIDYFGWRAKNKGGSSKLGGVGDTYEEALEEALKVCLNTLKYETY